MTGCLTAAYTVLDAWNVRRGLPPVLYAWATIPAALLLLTPFASRMPGALRDARSEGGLPIILVAALMTGGYLLVLLAVRIAPVSYVAPARELSIVFGTLLGLRVLREPHPASRVTGAGLILLGISLLAAAGR